MYILIELNAKTSSFSSTSAGSGMNGLSESLGINLDPTFSPVPIQSTPPPAFGFSITETQMDWIPDTLVVRAQAENQEHAESLKKNPQVREVWSDPEIAPFIDCQPRTPKGNAGDIDAALQADDVRRMTGKDGNGIIVGIVDGGVDGNLFAVGGGWSPDPAKPPGHPDVVWGGHGNMCAFDARIAAPGVSFFDYAIGRTTGNIPNLLSSALQSFEHALQSYKVGQGPQVLTNSWGLYQQAWDPFRPGHPSNYTHNRAHPFIRKTVEVMDAGILVSFAAGNCGSVCPDGRCGADIGPGRSISGANGHDRVITVGAVNLNDEWIGYSSQGPSTLYPEKPDVAGYSHFKGFFPSDTGTSAACPVVAGVLALLRSIHSNLNQDQARSVLQRTARQRGNGTWNNQFGYGVVDALAAHRALLQ